MNALRDKNTLLLLQKDYHVPGRAALAQAAQRRGWEVKQVSLLRSMLPVIRRSSSPEITAYGSQGFVTRMARRYGRAVLGPPEDWFAAFPDALRKPWHIREPRVGVSVGVGFGIPDWRSRFFVLVAEGNIVSISVWARGNSKNYHGDWMPGIPRGSFIPRFSETHPITNEEEESVHRFFSEMMKRVSLPPVFGMTLGMIEPDGRMLVDQLYAASCCPFRDSDVDSLLPLLLKAVKPLSELRETDLSWRLQFKKGLLRLDSAS